MVKPSGFLRGVLLGAALAAPTAASAQPAQPPMSTVAMNYLENGNQLFAEGRFNDAARAFREAHSISRRPEILFNIGRSLERAGDPRGALEAYTLYEAAGAPGGDREALRATIQTLTTQVQSQDAQAQQHQQQQAQQQQHQQQQLQQLQQQLQQVEQNQRRYREVVHRRGWLAEYGPWGLYGVSALSVGFGVAILFSANAAARSIPYAGLNAGTVPWSAELTTNYSAAVNGQAAFGSMLGFGFLAAAGGAVWMLLRAPRERREMVPVTAWVLPEGGGAVAWGGTL